MRRFVKTPGIAASAHQPSGTASPDPLTPSRRTRGFAAGGDLRRLHWFVVLLSLVLTLLAWSVSTRALQQRNAQRFGRQADKVIAQFVEQLQRHADILTAAAGLVTASEEVTGDEWQRFAATLDLEAQFPALSGIGVAHHVPAAELSAFLAHERTRRPGFALHPANEQPEHLLLVHITPARLGSTYEGLDLAHERRRRDAAARAARLGTAQLTAPLTLSSSDALGIIMMVPFYEGGPVARPDERVARFAGVVAASMRLENLTAGTLDIARRQIRVRISDGAAPLHDEIALSDDELDPAPMYALTRDVPVYGRLWRFDVQSTLGFRGDANRMQPILMLVGGLCIDALLLALLLQHARAERRLIRAASDLRAESAALACSNEKLEAFACVASHDLKAPLFGIRTLVGFVEEDLDDYLRGEDAAPEVARNLARVERETARAEALIEGILDYSGLDDRTETCERVDTRIMLEEIAEMLDVDPTRLELAGDLPVFETYATRLRQVLANLIGNAFKYHHDAGFAHVRVAAEEAGARYRFTVSDDGPGIATHLHGRIFEPFDTGEAGTRHDSTGIGLAIVRKSIETMGGTISVDSAPGRGATFVFDWPKRIERSRDPVVEPRRESAGYREAPSTVTRRAA